MPLLMHLDTDEGSTLGLWRMDETVEELKGFQIPKKDGEDSAVTSHPLRQKQQICTRILLDKLLGTGPIEMTKDPSGRPWPSNKAGFLSISHNRDYVAVIYHPTRPCGIDIEQPTHRILSIASRFVHPAENEQIRTGHVLHDTTLIWCVKECLFKQIGRQGVNFKEQLRVEFHDREMGTAGGGRAFDLLRNPPLRIDFRWLRLDDALLVHTIA